MLSESWVTHKDDALRRKTLFRGISQVIISLARVPQPRIGSFRFHNNGTTSLTNKPLLSECTILENNGVPRVAEPADTYTCAESFVADMISLHDNRLRHDPSAADDEEFCLMQMGSRSVLRTVTHHFIRREYRAGPFVLQLTDLHQSNIFVDDDWNVTSLIDLEWLCALPVDSLAAPHWLTGCSVEGLKGKRLEEYEAIRQEFMSVFNETAASEPALVWPLAEIMQQTWASGGPWFWWSLFSVNAAVFLVPNQLCRKFSVLLVASVERAFSQFWSCDADEFSKTKPMEFLNYTEELRSRCGKGKEERGRVII